MVRKRRLSRRELLKTAGRSLGASSVLMTGFPAIVPASVFGQTAPGNLVNVGVIGVGRIGRGHDMPGILKHDKMARITAVCDLDANRLAEGKRLVEDQYAQKGISLR